MKRLLIALTLVIMVLPVAAWSMATTTNTDFEGGFQTNGIANGWYPANAAITTGFAGESAPANVHSGAWSQRVATAGGGVKARIVVAQPGLCTVSVWVKASTVGSAKVAIMPEDGVVSPSDYLSNTVANTWQKLSKTVVAKRSVLSAPDMGWIDLMDPAVTYEDSIVIHCGIAGGTSYFDEVSVVPVGEHIQPKVVFWNQVGGGDAGGNPFLIGGVFDGNVILGQISNCAKMYGLPYVGWDAPPLHQTPADIGNVDFTAKCATILNGYTYATTGYGDIRQSVDWGALGPIINFNNNPAPRQKVANDSSTLVTDGTYLYSQDHNLGGNTATNTIYKFAVNHAGGGSISNAGGGFPKVITGYSQFLGIGYYGGKIYAAEGLNGGQILEIDTGTGVATPLLSAPNLLPNTGGSWGQVARFGDKIFVGTASGNLYTWKLISGTWTLVSGYDISLKVGAQFQGEGYTPVLGLAASSATGLWTTTGAFLRYFDLDPVTESNLGDIDFGAGGSAWVSNAVITALGPTDTGFWIENQGRTAGAWVPTAEVATVGNLVSIKGIASKSASGERTLTPSEAIVQGAAADPVLTPLMMTNKTLGLATGGVGLATDGMLVKISGKVTGFVEADNFAFYIDDGSGVLSGIASPAVGVKVTIADGSPGYTVENFESLVYTGTPCTAVVTGIVRLDVVGGSIVRRIDARSAADVVITAL